MDSFFGDEEYQFYEAMKFGSFDTLPDLINLSFNLNRYPLIQDIGDMGKIGREYGRASDALTFSVLLRIPRLRPPSLPSNIGELRQRKNNQGAETHVFMLAGAGKFSTIID